MLTQYNVSSDASGLPVKLNVSPFVKSHKPWRC